MSPERVRDYWCILAPQLEQIGADADGLRELDPVDLAVMATMLHAIARQIETLSQYMPGVIAINGEHARLLEDEEDDAA